MRRNDLAYVAAQAAGEEPELPMVDDLEIAALAAGAAFDGESDSSETSSETTSSRSEAADEAQSPSSESDEEEQSMIQQRVTVQFNITGDNRVDVALNPMYSLESRRQPTAPMDVSTSDDDVENENTSSEESSSDDEGIEEITDYNQIRQMIDAMDDGDEGFGNGGAITTTTAVNELFGDQPLPELDDISISDTDILTPAGKIMSVIEGMIVVRAAGGSRALAEGTVLVLEDKTVLGVVEDVFGPVSAPLYAMRYINSNSTTTANNTKISNGETGGDGNIEMKQPGEDGETSKEVQQQGTASRTVPEVDMMVYAIERLSGYLLPEAYMVKGYDGDAGEEGEEGEPHFSDDEAEAEYKRKLKAKRKGTDAPATGSNTAKQAQHAPRPQRTFRGGRGGGRGRGRYNNNATSMNQPPPPYNQYNQGYIPPQQQHQQYQQIPQFQQQQYGGFRLAQPHEFHPAVNAQPPQFNQQAVSQGGGPGAQRVFQGLQRPHQPSPQWQAYATAAQLASIGLQQQPPPPQGPPPPSQ